MKNAVFCLPLFLSVLSACGGGNGGGSTATISGNEAVIQSKDAVPNPVLASYNSSIDNTAQIYIYPAVSEESFAIKLLNEQRVSCGFGTLAQNISLDAAAKAHAEYQLLNSVVSHYEDSINFPIGFTAVQPIDRANKKGYIGAGEVGDEFAIEATSNKAGSGIFEMRGLLNAPYHLKGLMSGYRDVGISVRSSTDVGTPLSAVFLQIDAGFKKDVGKQLLASSEIQTYPCEGSTGINFAMSAETPNPVPNRDLAANPLGSSVYIQVRDGNTLTISSASMTQLSNGRPITLRTPITSANDPYSPCIEGCYKSNQGYIVADAPMRANSVYQVNIAGTNNGTPFSKSFNFSTGSGNF